MSKRKKKGALFLYSKWKHFKEHPPSSLEVCKVFCPWALFHKTMVCRSGMTLGLIIQKLTSGRPQYVPLAYVVVTVCLVQHGRCMQLHQTGVRARIPSAWAGCIGASVQLICKSRLLQSPSPSSKLSGGPCTIG